MQYSGTNSLQLSFALFGLGETPNFIEDLTVGAGYSLSSDVEHGNWTPQISLGYHQWSLLVPNSQVIVSLYPIDKPDKYVCELLQCTHNDITRDTYNAGSASRIRVDWDLSRYDTGRYVAKLENNAEKMQRGLGTRLCMHCI